MCLINNSKYIFNVNQVQISYASVFAHVDIVSPLTFQKAIQFHGENISKPKMGACRFNKKQTFRNQPYLIRSFFCILNLHISPNARGN